MGLPNFFLLTWEAFLQNSGDKQCVRHFIANIFSHPVACLFTLWWTFFKVTVTPSIHFLLQGFWCCVFCQKSLLTPKSQSPCFSGQQNTSLWACSLSHYWFYHMPLGSKSNFSTQKPDAENLPMSAMLKEKSISTLHLNKFSRIHNSAFQVTYFDPEKVSPRSNIFLPQVHYCYWQVWY